MKSEYQLNGGLTRFSFSWPYLDPQHVVVLVDGKPKAYKWITPQEVEVTDPFGQPVLGLKLTIMRVTPDTEPFARIKDAGNLTADQLNRMRLQLLYLLQERAAGISGDLAAALNASAGAINNLNSDLANIKEIQAALMKGLITLDTLLTAIPRLDNDAKIQADALLKEIQDRIASTQNVEQKVDKLSRQFGDFSGVIETVRSVLADSIGTLASEQTKLRADFGTATSQAEANILTLKATIADGDRALSTRIDKTYADFQTADGALSTSITNVAKAQSDATAALASRVSSIEGTIIGGGAYDDRPIRALIQEKEDIAITREKVIADKVTQVQSELGGKLATVETTAKTAIDKANLLTAEYTIKVQGTTTSGKKVIGGIGVAAGGSTEQSEVILLADRFLLATPRAGTADKFDASPLMVAGKLNGVNTTVFSASYFGDQTIGAKVLVDGSIQARHMLLTTSDQCINIDPQLLDESAWEFERGCYLSNGTSVTGASGSKFLTFPGGNSNRDMFAWDKRYYPLDPGKAYSLTANLFAHAASHNMYLTVDMYDSAFNRVTGTGWGGSFSGYTYGSLPPTDQWRRFGGKFGAGTDRKIPANVRWCRIMVWGQYSGQGGTSSNQFAQDVRLQQCIDYNLIVDGGIKAANIDTEGLTIKQNGRVIFGAGTRLTADQIIPDNGWLNSQITLGGLGFTGDFDAQSNSRIVIDGDGRLSGIGSGSGTPVANSSVTIDANGQIRGIGTGVGSPVVTNITQGSVRTVARPFGGSYGYTSGNIQGQLKIALPRSWTNTMVRFTVSVYEYTTGAVQTYQVGGYSYQEPQWYNCFASYTGPAHMRRAVTFALDDATGGAVVLIGYPGQVWTYPQVAVTNVSLGYSNYDDYRWDNGWNVDVVTRDNFSRRVVITSPNSGGEMGMLDRITASNALTYIEQAAIKSALIESLTGDKITARSITTDRLVVNSVTTNTTSGTGFVVINPSYASSINTGPISLGQVTRTGGVCRKKYAIRFDAFNEDRYYTAFMLTVWVAGGSWVYTLPFGAATSASGRAGRVASTQITLEVFDPFPVGSPSSPVYEEDQVVIEGYPVDWDNRGNLARMTCRVAVDRLYQEFKL